MERKNRAPVEPARNFPITTAAAVLTCPGAKGQGAQIIRAARSKAWAFYRRECEFECECECEAAISYHQRQGSRRVQNPSWTRSLERLTLQAKEPGRTCVESPPMKLHDKWQARLLLLLLRHHQFALVRAKGPRRIRAALEVSSSNQSLGVLPSSV